MTIRSGPWQQDEVRAYLAAAVIPIRVATAGRDGPLVQSLWFIAQADGLWCATQADAVVVRRMQRDPRVGWEVSGDDPPYRGVRGQGQAVIVEEAEPILRALIDRYGQAGTPLAAWLLGRVAAEVAIQITDLTVTSWDFAARMTPAPSPSASTIRS